MRHSVRDRKQRAGVRAIGDYATVAYRASDGMQLGVARFISPANDGDYATAVSMARDGTKVFVTVRSWWRRQQDQLRHGR